MRGPSAAALLAGALFGLLDPRPLYSVEIAQVVSGSVALPAHAPMAIHNGRVFSLVIDAAAVLLWAGLGEGTVCRILSVFMGALSCLSVTAVAYAFTASRTAAYAAPFVALAGVFTPDLRLHKYPLLFPVSQHDLGANGFHVALLSLSAVALRPRAGALLLGLAPGIHVALAGAAWLITSIGAWFDRETAAVVARRWRWILGGALLIALCWMLHHWLGPRLPAGDRGADLQYARAFMTRWDGHRAPSGGGAWPVMQLLGFHGLFLLAAWFALVTRPPRLERVRFWIAGQSMLTVVLVASTLLDEFAPGWAPYYWQALMPSRWLNLNAIVLPALLAGIAMHLSMRFAAGFTATRVRVALAGVALLSLLRLQPHAEVWGAEQPFLGRVGARPGLLLTASDPGGVEFVQLHTRRAPLLDIDLLDTLPYAPAAGPAMERILNDIHGVSLLAPDGRRALDGVRARWQARSPADWRELGRRYGVTDIMVPVDWRLTLPRVDESSSLALYRIAE